MINTLVMLLVVGIIIGMIWWLCDYLPVPHPLNKMIKIVSIVIGMIVVIYALLGIAGMAPALQIE
jgi:hypothetical protein